MLNRKEIETLIKEQGLITDYIDLDVQLTPNGFDLTAAGLYAFDSAGALDFSNKERLAPETRLLAPEKKKPQDTFGWWALEQGVYKIKTNETVSIPKDLVAVSFPRSSLLRMGIFTHTGVWDAGFQGKSEFVLVVQNPFGCRIKQNARVAQLVFARINETLHGYNGIYQCAQ